MEQLKSLILKELSLRHAIGEGMLVSIMSSDNKEDRQRCYEAVASLYHSGKIDIVKDKYNISNVIRLKVDYQ